MSGAGFPIIPPRPGARRGITAMPKSALRPMRTAIAGYRIFPE